MRASYNLLIHPEKAGYLEVLNPSKQLLNTVSLSRETLTVYWAKDGTYIQEPATSENLNAAIGLPLLPDDLLLLLSGVGLNFSEWKEGELLKDGWVLSRDGFRATLKLKGDISRIRIQPPSGRMLDVIYEDYQETDNRLLPRKMRFELQGRKLALQLQADKTLFRDDPPNSELFAIQLPAGAKKTSLKELYRGKPLLLDTH